MYYVIFMCVLVILIETCEWAFAEGETGDRDSGDGGTRGIQERLQPEIRQDQDKAIVSV